METKTGKVDLKSAYLSLYPDAFSLVLDDLPAEIILDSLIKGEIKLNQKQQQQFREKLKFYPVKTEIKPDYIVLSTGYTGRLHGERSQLIADDIDYYKTDYDVEESEQNLSVRKEDILFSRDRIWGNGLEFFLKRSGIESESSSEPKNIFKEKYKFEIFGSEFKQLSEEDQDYYLEIYDKIWVQWVEKGKSLTKELKQEADNILRELKENNISTDGIVVFRGDYRFWVNFIKPYFLDYNYQEYYVDMMEPYAAFLDTVLGETYLRAEIGNILVVEVDAESG